MTVYAEKRGGRATGVWIIEVGGVRKRHRDHGQALIIEASLKAGVDTGGPEKAEKAYTLRELARDSRARLVGLDEARSIETRMDHCVAILGPDTAAAAVDTAAFDRIVAALQARTTRRKGPMANSTINSYLLALSAALRWAVARPKITGVEHVPHIPLRKPGAPRDDVLTQDDERRVCAWLVEQGEPEMALCIEVLALTGLRAQELTALPLDCMRPPRTTEDALGWIIVTRDASKNEEPRVVPLAVDHWNRIRAVITAGKMPPYHRLLARYKEAVAAIGLPATVVLHTLRHTAGTRMDEEGVPSFTIQTFLGHKDPKTTRRYIHTSNKALERAAMALVSARNAGAGAGETAG